MTRFEASAIMFMVMAIMLILLFGVISIISTLNDIKQQHEKANDSILDVCNQQQSAWACDVTTIVKGINELNDVVDKMHRNLCVEIADKMVDRVYPPTYVTPCYAPNGICSNPFGDCINCPKRGTDGTWSTNTTIKAEGEMFQEKFNDSKED